jgi:curli production assembly/transport component CsgG
MNLWHKKPLAIGLLLFALTGCTEFSVFSTEQEMPTATTTRSILHDLPEPQSRLDIAVYEFEDLTGQFKPSEGFQTLSKAVSQGGGHVLVKALRDTGDGEWFRVVERGNLNNLLQERRVIQEMRQLYLGEKAINPQALPPLLFAGVIIEGGVVGYDTNTETGGAGAALLGIGVNGQFRKDTLSVNLRAVSVKSGEVLSSVVVQKSILSTSLNGSIFRYIDSDQLLEVEAGVTTNEPSFVALTRAIEKAVFSMIMEMAHKDLWQFKDQEQGDALVRTYLQKIGRPIEAKSTTQPGGSKPSTSNLSEPEPSKVTGASGTTSQGHTTYAG